MNTAVNANFALPGYRLLDRLYCGSKTVVYRGIRLVDSQPVAIKLLQPEYPTFHDLLQFRNQYAIAKNLNIPGIIRPYSLESYRNSYALVMEDFGGVSLRDYTGDRTVAICLRHAGAIPRSGSPKGRIAQALEIALQVADVLHDLHQNRVIHKDIKPANILIHPETKQVKLIDFSIASLLPKETQEIKNPNVLEGTLAYLAPEQTGRMNRGIDYRCDFYALGVTLFELLTGQLPFESDDPMELVHCHIAKQPPSLSNREDIPSVLANIVMKLMAKNAEERYQSALGLKYDLEICLHQLKEKGEIEAFEIGQRDLCDRFIIPEKLYGRESEVKTLLSAFERVSNGTSELMLVAGFSGIGKTAVVNEVHKPIVKQRGYFIKGKFDQFNRNIPFSAFVQAFRDLMGQLFSERDAQLATWKAKILQALGNNAQVIIEVIPELERIIGQQPPVPELSGSAAQNRFNLLFQKFIDVFTTKEHPLVMFLDDLQWADSASLNLLKLLMSEANAGYLLILGAYRDNEVFPAHPLMLALGEIEKGQLIINTITLAPLSEVTVNQLVADTLSCTPQLAHPLTQLVYQKTKGNPFFTTQFLKALHEEGWIAFQRELGYWQCDMTSVRQLVLTDDVVEFMALQLQKLPMETQEVLKLAACIGNQFDLETLAIVSENSPEQTAADLWKALQEGLIIPNTEIYKFFMQSDSALVANAAVNPTYRFLHDRVQQAAYSLIPEERKPITHYQIGQRLLENLSESEQNKFIFDLATHLNFGQSFVTQNNQQEKLAQLNLAAAQKAISATAYEAAIKYLEIGIGLLGVEAWVDRYDLIFGLYCNLCTAQLSSAQYQKLTETINILLQQVTSPIDRATIYVFQINQYILQGRYLESVESGLLGLNKLGIDIDINNVKELANQEFDAVDRELENRPIASLLDLPTSINPEIEAMIKLLAIVETPSYIIGNIELYTLLSLKAVRLSIEHGNISESIKPYSNYGILLCILKEQYARGEELGDLALKLSYKLNSKSQRSKVGLGFASWIQVWAKPIAGAAELNYESFLAGLESGETLFAAYNLYGNIFNRLFQGENLREIARDIEKYWLVAKKIKDDLLSIALAGAEIFVKQLYLEQKEQERDASFLDAENIIRNGEASQSWLSVCLYYILKMHFSCLNGCFQEGFQYTKKAKAVLNAIAGFTTSSSYYYYSSLILLNLHSKLSAEEQNDAWEQINLNQEKLQTWSNSCPENFLHKYLLIEAERYRHLGCKAEAIALYDRAISGAKENGYIQEEALANELAAKFYLDWGKEKVAAGYMQEAYYCYAKWGAKAKTDDLEKRYPRLLQPILQQAAQPLTVLETLAGIAAPAYSIHLTHSQSSSSTSLNNTLDFAALLKVSQALSSTIQLDDLIQILTQTMLENSGADKCALMLCQDGQWLVRAISDLQQTTLQTVPLEDNPALPIQLIYYVKNTLEAIVLDNLKTAFSVAIDPYLQQHQPKSVLCLPILNQGNLAGILYLENRLTSAVFTSDRLVVLNFLCNQAAISLENAKLHAQEQEKSYHLEQSQRRLKLLLKQTPVAVIEWNTNFEFQFWNRAAEKVFGYRAEEVLGQHFRCIIPEEYHAYVDDVATEILAQSGGSHAINENITKDGRRIICEWFNAPMFDANGEVSGGVSMGLDITERQTAEMALQQKSQELEQTLQELQQAQLQIVQSEKMSALGNLVAGVAHEINNPIGCIVGNVGAAQDYINDLLGIIDLYQEEFPQPSAKIEDELEAIDLGYVREDLPKLIKAMKDGGDRIKSISKSLRTFSRTDSDAKQKFNLHEGIDSTILILRHRLKANESRPAIEIITNYGDLPEIACFPGQLNQVFMNILANAIDALDESNFGRSFAEIQANPNQITIQTSVEDGQVKIAIADNGSGIPEAVKTRIFDHLFTTKGVGKGTGLGLAIAHQIVVKKHGGRLDVQSELGQGTQFCIHLPIYVE